MNELDLFAAASEIADPVKRNQFLDEACQHDPDLRNRIDRLLQQASRRDSFMEVKGAECGTVGALSAIQIGSKIGAYKLKEQIGEGGMGVVFVAEQQHPVKRRVALKIIKPGMDSKQVLARFEAERQALAMMDHPNIARVLDAGSTEQGLPFFVMELVNGKPITRYCDENRLTIPERLAVFQAVCAGVQHAHQKGVIHRDLKPTNILIAQYDGRPVPKVIDFGVAKATGQAIGDHSVYTEFGQVVGTIEYMSPEQAQRNQLDIDTRSDIYSLGVLLYELLTGEPPFDKQRLRSVAIDELFRIIREEDPPRPSTKVSTSQTQAVTAERRKSEPNKLNGIFRGELDWIVMKAMDKDRHRRYETANGFATDIQRFLNDETVQAHPPSRAYQFRKLWRKHRAGIILASAVTTFLIVATLISLWSLTRAQDARNAAVSEERKTAEANRLLINKISEVQEARSRSEELLTKLKGEKITSEKRFDLAFSNLMVFLYEYSLVDLRGFNGLERQRQRLLGLATEQFAKLIEEKPDRVDFKSIQARAMSELGKGALALNDNQVAREYLTQANRLYSELLRLEFDSSEQANFATFFVENSLLIAWILEEQQPIESESMFKQAIAIAESHPQMSSDVLADTRNQMGLFFLRSGKRQEAINSYRSALLVASDKARPGILLNLANWYHHEKEYTKSLDFVNQALAIDDWQSIHWKLNSLAARLFDAQGMHLESMQHSGRAQRGIRQHLMNDLAQTQSLRKELPFQSGASVRNLIDELKFRAGVHKKLSRYESAIADLESALAIFNSTFDSRLLNADLLTELEKIYREIGDLHRLAGRQETGDYFEERADEVSRRLALIIPPLEGRSFFIGGTGNDSILGIVHDDQDHFYVGGKASQNADLDPGVQYRGIPDFSGAFVARYHQNGSIDWVIPLGRPASGSVSDIDLDGRGNLIATGYFYSSDNQNLQLGQQQVTVPDIGNGRIGFVASITPQGQVNWVRWTGRGAPQGARPPKLATTRKGEIYVVGDYGSDSLFGLQSQHYLLKHRAHGTNKRRGYFACFSEAGSLQWCHSIEAQEASSLSGVSCDSDGNVYVSGVVKPLADANFGVNSNGEKFKLPHSAGDGESAGILVKISQNGATSWVRSQLTKELVISGSVAVGNDDKIYLSTAANINQSPIDLDGQRVYPNDIDVKLPQANTGRGVLVSCWNPSGELLWSRHLYCRWGKFVDLGGMIGKREDGVLILGYSNSIGTHFEGQNLDLDSFSGNHSLLAALSGQGELIDYCVYTCGIGSSTFPYDMSTNRKGHVAIAGRGQGRIRFPTGEDYRVLMSSDSFVTIINKPFPK